MKHIRGRGKRCVARLLERNTMEKCTLKSMNNLEKIDDTDRSSKPRGFCLGE